MWNKNNKPVHWSKKVGDFNTHYTSKVEIVLPELDATKSVMWNFHLDELQGNHRYNIILGHNILFKLKNGLRFSDNTTRLNIGAYEGCMAPMKDVSDISFNTSSEWHKDEIFWNEELWESEPVLDAMWRMCCILYKKTRKRQHT